ncbi:MAG: ribosomal-protein-alanine acetyltransferase [Gammaproteobacteria bacterium SG8_11]|nr:MAG: ribosomal-protein-alanine acetyltransferase [Gammaproteobacteria bacterium SG8_11]
MIRAATLNDLDELVRLEETCFDTDKMSRRSFRHMLTRGRGITLVYENENAKPTKNANPLCGYVMVLFHAGTSLARLYSIAVDPQCRGQGVGRRLVEEAEKISIENDCILMRLEVRRDNTASLNLFMSLGYRQFGLYPDYYEDHMEALRFEKTLGPQLKPALKPIPYYEQTLEFTCGPATLMMAMHALDPEQPLDRREEIRLWREATTVYMTSGHGGCGPYGLALAAYHRGYDVEIFVNEEAVLFINSVRSEDKKEVMRIVEEDFLEQLAQLPVKYFQRRITLTELREAFDDGGVPIVLISSYRIYHEKFPHWIVITGFDDKFVYVHDPYVDYEKGKTSLDTTNMPILQKDFEHMSRYGKSGQRAALILRKRSRKKAAKR